MLIAYKKLFIPHGYGEKVKQKMMYVHQLYEPQQSMSERHLLLSKIDRLVDNMIGCKLLNFLDAYLG